MGERVTFKTDEQAAPELTVRIVGRASSLARGGARSAPRNDSEVSSAAVQAMARYIGRFDRDGDGALNQSEWSKLPRDYAYADLDGDGKITASEFVRAMKRGPPEAGGQRSQ